MFKKCLENVRETAPLIHCITNYVTVNDVANALLGIGASPIMSDEPDDVADICNISNGLCLNIGTLNKRSIEAMFIASNIAKRNGNIVLLDPVGAGATKLRTETALKILTKVKPEIVKGNISEIKALAVGTDTTKGVDADETDSVTEENLDKTVNFVKAFSKKTGAVIAVTGKIDLVADEKQCFVIRNGISQMSKITGCGCMLSGIATAYCAANHSSLVEALAAAVSIMGLSGEIALSELGTHYGNATLRTHILDALYNIDGDMLKKGAKYEIR